MTTFQSIQARRRFQWVIRGTEHMPPALRQYFCTRARLASKKMRVRA